jgi:alpha-tubulin suppressor-like RCC1 family protein
MGFLIRQFVQRPHRRRAGPVLAIWFVGLLMASAAPASATPNIAMAWGENEDGQLGNGTTGGESFVPVEVSEVSGVTALSAGEFHSLALLESGNVMAWGSNREGQLGDGTFTNGDVPMAVSGLSGKGIAAISAGGEFSLAFGKEGVTRTVYAWGANESGQLGDKKNTNSDVPVVTKGLGARTSSAIAAGYEFSLALQKEGTVMSWGENEAGQLGDGTDEGESYVPVAVSKLSNVAAVSAGEFDSLALLSNGTVMSWGENDYGQLGDGSFANSEVPVAVNGLSGVTAIAAGGEFNLALLSNGTVKAWGLNESGQLGNGTFTNSDVPVTVSELSSVTAIAAGGEHSLALLSNGTVMAWGDNEQGQLGDDEEEGEESDVPVAVSGLSNVKGIAAGESFSLAFGPTAPKFDGVARKPSVGERSLADDARRAARSRSRSERRAARAQLLVSPLK